MDFNSFSTRGDFEFFSNTVISQIAWGLQNRHRRVSAGYLYPKSVDSNILVNVNMLEIWELSACSPVVTF